MIVRHLWRSLEARGEDERRGWGFETGLQFEAAPQPGPRRSSGVASPPLDVYHQSFAETVALGYGQEDMAAVARGIEAPQGQDAGSRQDV